MWAKIAAVHNSVECNVDEQVGLLEDFSAELALATGHSLGASTLVRQFIERTPGLTPTEQAELLGGVLEERRALAEHATRGTFSIGERSLTESTPRAASRTPSATGAARPAAPARPATAARTPAPARTAAAPRPTAASPSRGTTAATPAATTGRAARSPTANPPGTATGAGRTAAQSPSAAAPRSGSSGFNFGSFLSTAGDIANRVQQALPLVQQFAGLAQGVNSGAAPAAQVPAADVNTPAAVPAPEPALTTGGDVVPPAGQLPGQVAVAGLPVVNQPVSPMIAAAPTTAAGPSAISVQNAGVGVTAASPPIGAVAGAIDPVAATLEQWRRLLSGLTSGGLVLPAQPTAAVPALAQPAAVQPAAVQPTVAAPAPRAPSMEPQVSPAASVRSTNSAALLSLLLSDPALQQALRNAAVLGAAAPRSLQLALPTAAERTTSVPVPISSVMEAIAVLAEQASSELAPEAADYEFTLTESGDFAIDPANPRQRAELVTLYLRGHAEGLRGAALHVAQ